MASPWLSEGKVTVPYNCAERRRKQTQSVKVSSKFKSGVSSVPVVVVKRGLNMSSSYSRKSRVLLAVMRSQLANSLEQRKLEAASRGTTTSYSSLASCNNCGGFMVQPVCMPCGHSVCKACVEKSTVLSGENLICPKCNHAYPKMLRTGKVSSQDAKSRCCRTPTLILQNAFCKWYPKWVESCRHREEGNQHANQGDFASAIVWYTEALQTGM